MISQETILLDYGADGGGATVYQLPNGTVIERGSGGGMDEEEDPVRTWEKNYDNWECWWQSFIAIHKDFWIYFHPCFIHDDIKPFIQIAVDNYKSDQEYPYHKEDWNRALRNNSKPFI